MQGGGEGGGLSKSSKPINGLSSIICNLCQGYGNILYMYVLPDEQTDCPILTGKHIKCTLIMHINILCKICFPIFDGLCYI